MASVEIRESQKNVAVRASCSEVKCGKHRSLAAIETNVCQSGAGAVPQQRSSLTHRNLFITHYSNVVLCFSRSSATFQILVLCLAETIRQIHPTK